MPRIVFVPRTTNISQVKPSPEEIQNESLPTERYGTPPSVSKLSTGDIAVRSSTLSNMRTSTAKLFEKDVTKTNFDKIQPPPSTKSKMTVPVVIVIIIVLVCAVAATLPPVLLTVLRSSPTSSSSSTTTSVSVCSTQTCIGHETPFRTSMATAVYPFYGNALDLTGTLGGTGLGLTSPAYYIPWSNINSLCFTSTSQQYVSIPYMSLAKQSFTLQMWIYLVNVGGQVDYGLFGQCGSDLNCLSLSLRNGRVTLIFDSLNSNGGVKLTGSTIISAGVWTHITAVYDAVEFQQIIYINGNIDAMSSGMVNSYQGTSTGGANSIAVSSSLGYQPSYFSGCMNLFTISVGSARSACQVYSDGGLMAYFPFDANSTWADHSINLNNGYALGATITSSGHIQEALMFSQATSCFQAQCFTSPHYNNPPFSVSLWINPTVVNNGTIVHVSTNQQGNGAICFDLLTFTSTGAIVAQLYQSAATTVVINGPVLSINTWTHLAVVYSSTNSFRLFVNGQVYLQTTGTTANWPFNSFYPLYVTLGNNSPTGSVAPSCPSSSALAIPGSYKGMIDDFRMYSRELNSQEICVLANM